MALRFHKSFVRQKGHTGPVLGNGTSTGDTAPGDTTGRPGNANAATGTGTANQNGWDNVFEAPFNTVNGWPSQRIVVATQATFDSASTWAVTANGYMYEELTETWHLVNASPVTIKPNQFAYFDVVCVPQQTQNQAALNIPANGSIVFMLQVIDGGTTSNGTFTFAIAPDTTSSP